MCILVYSYLKLVQDQVGDISLPICTQHVNHLSPWVRRFCNKMGKDPHQGILVLKGQEKGKLEPNAQPYNGLLSLC